MKTKELKKYNLPEDRRCISSISAKPYGIMVIIIIIGVILSWNNQVFYGGGLVAASLIMFFILPDRIMIEFYKDYMILFNKSDKNDCEMVFYEDVVSWNYRRGAIVDELLIELVDGSIEKVEGFSKKKYESSLAIFLPDKKLKTK